MRERAVGGDGDGWIRVTPESMVRRYGHYVYFMEHFAPLVIGISEYLRVSHEKKPEEWLSSSGEAFAFMMIENYQKGARQEALQGDQQTKGVSRAGRWHLATSNQYGGVHMEWMTRYEELCEMVCASRRDGRRLKHSERYVVETKNKKLQGRSERWRKYVIKSGNGATGRQVRCEKEVSDY